MIGVSVVTAAKNRCPAKFTVLFRSWRVGGVRRSVSGCVLVRVQFNFLGLGYLSACVLLGLSLGVSVNAPGILASFAGGALSASHSLFSACALVICASSLLVSFRIWVNVPVGVELRFRWSCVRLPVPVSASVRVLVNARVEHTIYCHYMTFRRGLSVHL